MVPNVESYGGDAHAGCMRIDCNLKYVCRNHLNPLHTTLHEAPAGKDSGPNDRTHHGMAWGLGGGGGWGWAI